MATPANPTPGYENLVQCPYDKGHQILHHRVMRHLTKCGRQHPHIKLEICPYDTMHRLRPEDMEDHKKTCSGRARLEEYSNILYTPAETDLKNVSFFLPKPKVPDSDTNDWDELVGTHKYNASKVATGKEVLRNCFGRTKSERKQFYLEENLRMTALKAKNGEQPLPEAGENVIKKPKKPWIWIFLLKFPKVSE